MEAKPEVMTKSEFAKAEWSSWRKERIGELSKIHINMKCVSGLGLLSFLFLFP